MMGLFILLLALSAVPLWAEGDAAAEPAPEGITDTTTVTLQISTMPEAKIGLTETISFPFLRGDGPLTAGNDIKTAFTAEISPISLDGITEITWTPIAFFQLVAGAKAGSGWNNFLGNSIGINKPKGSATPRKSEIEGDPLGGLIWNAWGGAVLQFDLAALVPGDWNHVIFRTYHEGRYRGFTGAAAGEAWIFENDDGENRNGFIYYANALLGYQMPKSPFLNMAGILAEMEINLRTLEGGEKWGDELPHWRLSGLLNFTITGRLSTAFMVQMRTRRNYGSGDLNNNKKIHFSDQNIDNSDPYRLVFYRAALIMNYKLR